MNVESMQPIGYLLTNPERASLDIGRLIEFQNELLSERNWIGRYDEVYLSYNYADVLGVFLIEFTKPMNDGIDKYVWTVVGDLPPAYIVVDQAQNYQETLILYCDLMEEWIETVRSGKNVTEDIYPVEAIPTRDNADALASRVSFIRNEVIPKISE